MKNISYTHPQPHCIVTYFCVRHVECKPLIRFWHLHNKVVCENNCPSSANSTPVYANKGGFALSALFGSILPMFWQLLHPPQVLSLPWVSGTGTGGIFWGERRQKESVPKGQPQLRIWLLQLFVGFWRAPQSMVWGISRQRSLKQQELPGWRS